MQKLINSLLKRYTHQQIAEAAGYTTAQAVRNIASGASFMPIRRQKMLAAKLNVPVEKLMRAHIADIKAKY